MKINIFPGCALLFFFMAAMALASDNSPGFIDSSGFRIIVSKPYHRIISLYGAHSENLFSLGLDQEVIGVSRNETFPALALKKPVFSYHDDAERFLVARPDLVLIRPMILRGYPGLVSKLKHAGICVVSLQPNTVREMFSCWRKLGLLTGRQKQAQKMILEFNSRLENIRLILKKIPSSKRHRVYFESIHSKMKTFGPSAIAVFALEAAGGINVAGDAKALRRTNIADYGKERILAHANEIDLYLAQSGPMNQISIARIKSEPGFQAIKAVREGRIYIIDENIVSRPTLRLLEGIRTIVKILYPEIFNLKPVTI